jgi:hypothetical protein
VRQERGGALVAQGKRASDHVVERLVADGPSSRCAPRNKIVDVAAMLEVLGQRA